MNGFEDFGSQLSDAMISMNDMTEKIARDAKAEAARRRATSDATIETAKALRQINEKIDEERNARIESEHRHAKENKCNFAWMIVGVTISALTLLATLFGILVSLHLLPQS